MRHVCGSLCLVLVLASCATGGQSGAPPPGDAPLASDSSVYFDLGQSLPAAHRDKILRAAQLVDATLPAEPLLARLRAKSDWKLASPESVGDELVSRIRERRDASNAPVRPRVRFYTPPWIGVDVCGGKSGGPFYRTKSTGCTLADGTIMVSLKHISHDYRVVAEFLAHEWMHAADYGHGNNFEQDGVEKRNSVPIHVGCLVEAYPHTGKMDLCALSEKDANQQAASLGTAPASTGTRRD